MEKGRPSKFHFEKLRNMVKKLNMGFWKWAGVAAFLAIVIFSVWKTVGGNSTKVQYQTAQVTKGTVISAISASGKALTTGALTINTGASGVVKAVYVKDGSTVFAGQKIAEITVDTDGALANAKAWQNLSSAENSYRSTQASLANVYDQIQGHATNETFSQIETRTKAEVANDNAFTALAAARLSFMQTSPVITAPYAGTIKNINIVPGMVISPLTSASSAVSTQRIAVITNNSTPIINVSLSEIDVPNVKIGQKATVTFDSITGATFTGVVATVDRIGTVSSNVTSYTVNIKLDSASDKILPNMAATANIITQTATDVLNIPSTALVTQSGQNYTKTLVNGKEVDVPVEVGISSDTNTEIISGLTEGETVITGTVTTGTTPTTTRSVFSTGGFGGGAIRGATGRGG